MLVPRQYLGAFKCGHREKAKEFVDEDFSRELLARITASKGKDKKAVEALTYLTKFNNEFHKAIINKSDTTALHNTDKLRRDLYSKENSRSRDIYAFKERQISLETEDESEEIVSHSYLAKQRFEDFFDEMIERLDRR